MLTTRSTKCPWAFVGVAGVFVMLVTAVHVFMMPVLPSTLDFFGARCGVDRPRNALPDVTAVDSRLKRRFPADSYGAVTYRGAPWKAEIGRWLAGCHAGSSAVNITEVCTKLCHCLLFSDLACFGLILLFFLWTGYRHKEVRERLQWKWCLQL